MPEHLTFAVHSVKKGLTLYRVPAFGPALVSARPEKDRPGAVVNLGAMCEATLRERTRRQLDRSKATFGSAWAFQDRMKVRGTCRGRGACSGVLPMGIVLLFALGLAACGDPFRSVAELDENPQVLALAAEPPELGPGEDVSFSALVHWPEGAPTLLWLICIPDIGQSFLSCLQGEMGQKGDMAELPLCSQAPGARFCLAGVGSTVSYRVPEGFFPDDGKPHTFFVNLLASRDFDGLATCGEALAGGVPTGDCLLALKRVVVSHQGPRNLNPVVSGLTLDGSAISPEVRAVVESGEETNEDLSLKVGVLVDPGSVDELFPPDVVPRSHTLVVSWFTDCGSLGTEKSFLVCQPEVEGAGPTCEIPEVTWKPGTSGLCHLHVVARDGVGGTGWVSQAVELR